MSVFILCSSLLFRLQIQLREKKSGVIYELDLILTKLT